RDVLMRDRLYRRLPVPEHVVRHADPRDDGLPVWSGEFGVVTLRHPRTRRGRLRWRPCVEEVGPHSKVQGPLPEGPLVLRVNPGVVVNLGTEGPQRRPEHLQTDGDAVVLEIGAHISGDRSLVEAERAPPILEASLEVVRTRHRRSRRLGIVGFFWLMAGNPEAAAPGPSCQVQVGRLLSFIPVELLAPPFVELRGEPGLYQEAVRHRR